MEIINEIIEEKIEEWTNEGLSNNEIIARIEKLPLEELCVHVIDQGARVLFDGLREQVFEISAQYRVDTNLFLPTTHQFGTDALYFRRLSMSLRLKLRKVIEKILKAKMCLTITRPKNILIGL